jgi:hypothetical protein
LASFELEYVTQISFGKYMDANMIKLTPLNVERNPLAGGPASFSTPI